jgi:hypothetical protein
LKGKYFHDRDFMTARRKRNSSHIWNAILYGREALSKGLIKRIGDGSSIRVWEDHWIPGNYSRKPLVRKDSAEVIMVSELIDAESASWIDEKLQANFELVDIAAIRAIPISNFSEDDWAWELEKSGHFTVRSTYKMLVAEQFDNDSPSSSGSSSSLCWKKVWKLQVPPKVRAFWWRVIKGFVPCRQTLKLRHMEQIGFCKTCGADEETTFHALFECTWARRFWEGLHKAIGVKLPVLHRTSWAADLIDGKFLTEEQACYILCGAWAVWSERNAIWHGEGGRSVQQSVRWAT